MLISEAYRDQQIKLHENPQYGEIGQRLAPLVSKFCARFAPKTLLDYGCGKNRLIDNLVINSAIVTQGYDPAVAEFSAPPNTADMVTCTDVLEHIEPECIDSVLDDLQRLTLKVGVFSINTGPAMKTLPDGRNAHILQRPYGWWLDRLMCRFVLHLFQRTGQQDLLVVVLSEQYAKELGYL